MMAALFKDHERQQGLGKDILRYLTDHLILRGEKNLDLLQGLIVYISWSVSLFPDYSLAHTLIKTGSTCFCLHMLNLTICWV